MIAIPMPTMSSAVCRRQKILAGCRSSRLLLLLISPVVILSSCSQRTSNEQTSAKGFIYSKYITAQQIKETLDPINDLTKLSKFTDIPDSLFDEWIRHFREPGRRGNKLISLEHQSLNYNAILIGLIDEIYIDSINDTKDNWYSILAQFLITVKDDGSYIDGLKVQEYLSKADLDDSVIDGNEIMTQVRWSKFISDTALVFDRSVYVKDSVLNERKDYVDTGMGRELGVLQTVRSVELQRTNETMFIIDSNGKFHRVRERKGVLRKLGEQIGERIKPGSL